MKPEYETTGHKEELVAIDQRIYLHERRRNYDRPIILHLFYPMRIRNQAGLRMPVKILDHTMNYIYMCEHGLRWRLLGGGQAKPDPELTYEESIPCPQPRAKKTRYERGRWEKHTKAKGWEIIG